MVWICCFVLLRWTVPWTRIVIVSLLLVLFFVVHNFVLIQSPLRVYSFGALRVLRYTFVPFVLSPHTAVLTLIIMLPVIVREWGRYFVTKTITADRETLRPYVTGARSYCLVLLLFLPLQGLFVGWDGYPLLIPNAAISVVGMLLTVALRMKAGQVASEKWNTSLGNEIEKNP